MRNQGTFLLCVDTMKLLSLTPYGRMGTIRQPTRIAVLKNPLVAIFINEISKL